MCNSHIRCIEIGCPGRYKPGHDRVTVTLDVLKSTPLVDRDVRTDGVTVTLDVLKFHPCRSDVNALQV